MELQKVSPNVDVIHLSDGRGKILFSYGEPVAAFIPGRGYVRTTKYFSRTTMGHIAAWLRAAGPGIAGVTASVPHDEILRIAGTAR